MRHTLLMVCALAATFTATQQAAAQMRPGPTPARRWSIGVEGGAQAVEHVGGLGGAQLGVTVASRLDIFGEAVYLQDVASRRRIESANDIAHYLAQSQGASASATLEAPTWAFGAGARVFLTSGSFRPYVVAEAGGAQVTLRPALTLAGGDVTTTLPLYGVTLGSDLTGSVVTPMFGGGIGVSAGRGAWYFDAAVRVLSIQLKSQPSHASTFAIGIGRRF